METGLARYSLFISDQLRIFDEYEKKDFCTINGSDILGAVRVMRALNLLERTIQENKKRIYEERQARLRVQFEDEGKCNHDVPSMKRQLIDAGYGSGGVL